MGHTLTLVRRVIVCLAAGGGLVSVACEAAERPNILWLVAEDTSAGSIGCYGDSLARTPTIDSLAARGIVFDRCFTNPVCAPSRFTLITGMHAASCGPAHNMRAQGKIPADLIGFPALLRDAGYYTTNNSKTDYNAPIDVGRAWNASGKAAHYRDRPDADQPFFAVFNHEATHESCLFPEQDANPPRPPTDPATVRIPSYQPDTPEMRADWARHADRIATLDLQIRRQLDDLATDGLAEDTIVFFFGDNGGVTPRSKRFLQASGTRVPLIVHVPLKWRHLAPAEAGTRLSDPVGFVDFAATVLAFAGLHQPDRMPDRMHGQPFAGPAPQTKAYAFCSRDRMDERYDMSRAVADRRWLYIRHFRPDIPFVQPLAYQFRGRGYRSWARAARDGRLTPATAQFWGRKPTEELYDLDADPDTITNLVADPAHQAEVVRLRTALRDQMIGIRDNGLLPEGSSQEGYEQCRDQAAFSVAFPVKQVLDLALLASAGDAAHLPTFVTALDDPCEAVRWWAAQGCTIIAARPAGPPLPADVELILQRRLGDDSPAVRVAVAEALATSGRSAPALACLEQILQENQQWPTLQALNVLDRQGDRARPLLPLFKEMLGRAMPADPVKGNLKGTPAGKLAGNAAADQAKRYVRDLLAHTIAVLEGTEHPLVYPEFR